MVRRFQIMQTLGKNESKSVFSANYIAQMLSIIYKKSMLARKGIFLMHPTNPQIIKLTLTSLVTS